MLHRIKTATNGIPTSLGLPRGKPGRPKFPATSDPAKGLAEGDKATKEEFSGWGQPKEKDEVVWKRVDLEKMKSDSNDPEDEDRAMDFEQFFWDKAVLPSPKVPVTAVKAPTEAPTAAAKTPIVGRSSRLYAKGIRALQCVKCFPSCTSIA